jgi:undecaprenyl pyrophosphate phosphatase UppP
VRLFIVSPLLAAHDPLFPIRILAGIALVAVIAAFVHVLRHLKRIEREVIGDDLVPKERGPRNNMVLIVTAIPIVVTSLLLYLILKA